MQNKNRNINHSRVFLSGITTLLKGKAAETPDYKFRGWIKAFTLIELLVVVLIIGILAAVAVPQYRLAIYKTQFQQYRIFAQAIARAEEVYYLANGHYTKNIYELDVEISLPNCTFTDFGGYSVFQCANKLRMGINTNLGEISASWPDDRFIYVHPLQHGTSVLGGPACVIVPSKRSLEYVCKHLGKGPHYEQVSSIVYELEPRAN